MAASLAGGVPLVYPRREEKAYGTRRRIEGAFHPGERVVVIDDIVTDGASKLEAIEPLEAAGLVVEDLVVLIDREQGGRERLAAKGYRLHAVLTISACFDALESAGLVDPAVLERARAFVRTTRSPDARGPSGPISKICACSKVATRVTPGGRCSRAASSRARTSSWYWPRYTTT